MHAGGLGSLRWPGAFDAVCDELEHELSARREVVAGAGHAPQRTGSRFNAVLEGFLLDV